MQRKLRRSNRKSRPNYAAVIGAFLCVFLLSMGLTARAGATADGSGQPTRYRNVNFGYAVRVPAGVELETSKPPNPNHGFRISLGSSSFLWVDASYTDDKSLHAAVRSEIRSWGDSCQELASKPTLLGGLPASRITLKCAGGSEEETPRRITLVVAVFSQPDNSTIQYEVGAQERFEQQNGATNSRELFSRLVKGFYLVPRQ
jgi:hypothetical protein